MDEMVRVPLTEAEKAERGERLARLLKEREALLEAEKKRREDSKDSVESLDAIILDVATDLREGRRDKAQRDLFVDEVPAPPKDQAAQLLTTVHEEATALGFVADAAGYVERAPEAHQPELERHAFLNDTGFGCDVTGCGRPDYDPIHAPTEEEARARAREHVLGEKAATARAHS